MGLKRLDYALLRKKRAHGKEVIYIPVYDVLVLYREEQTVSSIRSTVSDGKINIDYYLGGIKCNTCLPYNDAQLLDMLAAVSDVDSHFILNHYWSFGNGTCALYYRHGICNAYANGTILPCAYLQNNGHFGLTYEVRGMERARKIAEKFNIQLLEYNTIEIDKGKFSIRSVKRLASADLSQEEQSRKKTVPPKKSVEKSPAKEKKEKTSAQPPAQQNSAGNAKKDSPKHDELTQKLLNCDKNRCRLTSYEMNRLTDIELGHWDLFENADLKKKLSCSKYVPRDPHKDIRKQGIVGIDFGTTSTVVMWQDSTSDIIPLRIGSGDLSKAIDQNKDYENPTIVECTNLDKFLEA